MTPNKKPGKEGDIAMARGREKDRELRRKHRKNRQRIKAREAAQRRQKTKS